MDLFFSRIYFSNVAAELLVVAIKAERPVMDTAVLDNI